MGNWEGLVQAAWGSYPHPSDAICEVPDCISPAVTAFLPAFESPGGWTGDHQEYAPSLEIAMVCAEHRPNSLKEE
jgi:hypothetical protein